MAKPKPKPKLKLKKKGKGKGKGKGKKNQKEEEAAAGASVSTSTSSSDAPTAATLTKADPWPYYQSMGAIVRRAAPPADGSGRSVATTTVSGSWGGLGGLLEQVRSSIASVVEVEALVDIDPAVSIARFQDDAAYMVETLLTLALIPRHFNVICAMGLRHSVPKWQLYQALATGIVCNGGDDGGQDAAALFKKHRVQDGLQGIPSKAVAQMASTMLDAVDGRDLSLLHTCYKLLAFVDASSNNAAAAAAIVAECSEPRCRRQWRFGAHAHADPSSALVNANIVSNSMLVNHATAVRAKAAKPNLTAAEGSRS